MPETQIARALHEEHMATLALLERLESLLGRNAPAVAPVASAPVVAAVLRDFADAVSREIATHFAFEERALFPLLDDEALTAMLAEEHRAMLPAAAHLADMARAALACGFDPALWRGFHAGAGDLAGALAAHVEKEEMALLPALDDALDAETDGRLAMDYAAQH